MHRSAQVILGATRVTQLEETLGAIDVVPKLTPDLMEEIESVLGTRPELSEVIQQVIAMRGPPPAAKL